MGRSPSAVESIWTRMQSNVLQQGVYKYFFLSYTLVSFFTIAVWESQVVYDVLSRVFKDN
jgi:hypothetical protein